MKRITGYFFRGLLVLVPVVATIWSVVLVFQKLNELLFRRLGAKVEDLLNLEGARIVSPVLGAVTTFVLITVVGVVASSYLGRPFVNLVEKVFEKLPLVKLLYGAIKDLLSAFVGDKKGFEKPVIVSLSEDGATRALGFVTRESLDFLDLAGSVAVYLPQSYNFAGQLLVVPAERVQRLDAESSAVMKFVVSGGVSALATPRPRKDA